MLFCTSFKLIILGAAIIIPWNSIRDFWVKISMCVFLVKSSKRIRKTWKKGKKKNLQTRYSTRTRNALAKSIERHSAALMAIESIG